MKSHKLIGDFFLKLPDTEALLVFALFKDNYREHISQDEFYLITNYIKYYKPLYFENLLNLRESLGMGSPRENLDWEVAKKLPEYDICKEHTKTVLDLLEY